ncbi:BPI fold-containing family A member 2 isoform X3 [Elephas maximus indicus]|uniref:BPI fold-containing family A member 2 isoform X3 n=1 Tax=Elephas maximus indicus TaxID=99487 RepID=UPI00211723E5|nr:BPI fold-containing family A member 2 isoform X3 [Elephas maximus indicus]
MFQLWKLALLCGLLTGTSASLLGNFGNDPNVLDNLKPILDKGLETVDNTLETVDNTLKTADNSVQDDLQKLKLKIEGLQDSKAWQAIQEKYQETGKLLDKGLSGLISDIKSLGPLIGNIVNLNAALDILTGVSIDIDTQTGLPVVILGECTSDPDSVQVNLLNRHSALINRIANTLSSFLRKTVSFTVQKEVCLLIRFFLNTLGVNVIPNIINKLQDGIHLQI